jgi:hypothetical protein
MNCQRNVNVITSRGKVKTKHDITWFAQKTNVDQLNPAYVYDSGGVNNFVYAIEGVRRMF